MSLSLQIVLSGLAAGSVYGLLAVGYVLVYRLTGIVHFALGDLVGLGVFVALFVTAGQGAVTEATASSWRFVLGLLVALAVVPALTAATWFGIIQPQVGRGSTLGWVAATVAIAFAIQSFVSVVFARPAYVFPDPIPFHDAGRDGVVTVAGATFQLRSLYVIALGVALALLVEYVVGRTRFGRGLQAIAQDAEGASVVGVPYDRFVGLAFGARRRGRGRDRDRRRPERAVFADDRHAARSQGTGRGAGGRLPLAHVGVCHGPCARRGRGGDRQRRDLRPRLGPSYREVLPILAVLLLLSAGTRAGARAGMTAVVGVPGRARGRSREARAGWGPHRAAGVLFVRPAPFPGSRPAGCTSTVGRVAVPRPRRDRAGAASDRGLRHSPRARS